MFRHLVYSEFNEFSSGEIEAGLMHQGEPARKEILVTLGHFQQ